MNTNKSWLAMRLERVIKTSHSMQHTGACAVAAGLLLAASLARAGVPPVDGGMPGPYPIGHTSFVCKGDEDPGRQVAVDVYYPADAARITAQSAEALYPAFPYENNTPFMTSSQWEAFGYDRAYESPLPARGPFPIIVFVPGYICPGWGYMFFGLRLASHGYIVAITTPYKEGPFFQTIDWPATMLYYRPRDGSSALTEMLNRDATPGDLLHRIIDRRYMVAAGHSVGGYAACTEICGDDQVADCPWVLDQKNPQPSICQPTPPDPRFNALLTLDGSSPILRWEELSRISVPSLIMGEASMADEAPCWVPTDWTFVARPHAAIAANTRAVRVDLRGVEHLAFADVPSGFTILHNAGLLPIPEEYYPGWLLFYTPGATGLPLVPRDEGFRMITKYVVAWLKAEVVKDGTELAQRILTQAYTKAHEPNVEVYWNEDCKAGGILPPGTFTYFRDMAPGTCAVGDKNPEDFFVPYP